MNDTRAKILFVNEEQHVLKSLQQLLSNEQWDCVFVKTATEGLNYLNLNNIDIVVSDINLTEVSCLEFINDVHHKHPSVVRICLTNTPKAEKTLQSLACGKIQQIIPNPWNDQEFKDIIRSALRQIKQQKNHSIEFQKLINSVPLLPMLPKSYANIRACKTNDEIDITKMVTVISQDAAMSAILLHWANSALFGQRFHVDSIKKAIIVLGTDIVETLILSESINSAINVKLPEIKGFCFTDFKRHSMATAIISRLLVKSLLPTDFIQHDRAFIAGLLHDIGKLVAANFFSSQFEQSIALTQQDDINLIDAERKIFKTDHTELGGYIAEWWGLPPFIVNAIRWAHQPHLTPIDHDIIAATHVASQLSIIFDYGCKNNKCLPGITTEYHEKFCLNEEANEILQEETRQIILTLVQ